ncbi:MAG TPA: acetate--CoA ligase family protein [Polyangiales bacterium]|nr:acetate--CoA ligase family protein [Polyangiales bacterium]
MTTPVFCETGDLLAEAVALAARIGLSIEPELTSDPLDAAARAARDRGLAAALCVHVPEPARAIDALHVCSERGRVVLGALSTRDGQAFGLASDLGIVCVRDVAPALAALCLLAHGGARAFRANAKKLSAADQVRLERALSGSERGAGRLLSDLDGVSFQRGEQAESVRLGHGLAVAQALRALSAAESLGDTIVRLPPPPDLFATRDVLFGPPRLLSDPASKVALAPFGLPMPQEELCASPSRAAAEAARIGFPVRISLASPDLRVWDHPALSVDGVDNAARVRDVYRQLQTAAQDLKPEARVLGVTVTATTLARALIRVSARPAPQRRVILRAGFADPHGAITRDGVSTVLPASSASIERALSRLAGVELLLGSSPDEREKYVALLSQLFARVASFVDLHRNEIERLELHPVALLVGGSAEVREAAIEVNDAFLRELDQR